MPHNIKPLGFVVSVTRNRDKEKGKKRGRNRQVSHFKLRVCFSSEFKGFEGTLD